MAARRSSAGASVAARPQIRASRRDGRNRRRASRPDTGSGTRQVLRRRAPTARRTRPGSRSRVFRRRRRGPAGPWRGGSSRLACRARSTGSARSSVTGSRTRKVGRLAGIGSPPGTRSGCGSRGSAGCRRRALSGPSAPGQGVHRQGVAHQLDLPRHAQLPVGLLGQPARIVLRPSRLPTLRAPRRRRPHRRQGAVEGHPRLSSRAAASPASALHAAAHQNRASSFSRIPCSGSVPASLAGSFRDASMPSSNEDAPPGTSPRRQPRR